MLRITLDERPGMARIKIEGRLCGPYVEELNRTWRALQPETGDKKISVDLCGMTGVDEAGKRLLAEMYSKSRVDFITRSVLTEYFAEQARERGQAQTPQGETKCASRTLVN